MKNLKVDVKIKKTKTQEDFDTMLNSIGTVNDLCKIAAEKIDKHQFKVCEAVALGLTYYYMGKNDRRQVTEKERAEAHKIIPTLPEGWMKQKHEWDACVE